MAGSEKLEPELDPANYPPEMPRMDLSIGEICLALSVLKSHVLDLSRVVIEHERLLNAGSDSGGKRDGGDSSR